MKKYYLHNGTDQQGPFDIDDLKAKHINKNTPVWYEGLDNWTTAEKIEELKDIFKSVPPPFEEVKKAPPIQNQTVVAESKASTPNKKSKAWLWIILIVVGILGIGAIMVLNNNPNSVPGIKVQINPPNPTVITSRADDGKSGLFKERTTVYATVQNQGGAGNVLVKFHVYQDGNDFDRTQQIFLGPNESQDLEVTFDEVKMLGGKITYDVSAEAQ